MSAFLFRIVINWIMRKTTEKLTTTLARRVDIADDIALLSSKLNHSQDKLSRLNQFGSKVGLKINTEKTKVLRLNSARPVP